MKFDMPKCGGCRTCELACSYHHEKSFNPSKSSLRVLDKDDNKGYIVEIYEKDTGGAHACDGCEGLEIPLCMDVCKEKEILKEFIDEVIKKKAAL